MNQQKIRQLGIVPTTGEADNRFTEFTDAEYGSAAVKK